MNSKIWFQQTSTPIMEGIVDLHNHIFGFLVFVFFLVLWVYLTTLYYFWLYPTYKQVDFRYYILGSRKLLHSTGLETFWTIVPSFILVSIGIPSFALLYAMDEVVNPQMTVKVVGHQWYWSYEYSAENWLREKKVLDIAEIFHERTFLDEGEDESYRFINLINLENYYNYLKRLALNEEWENISFDSYMKNESELLPGELRLLATTEQVVLPIQTHIRLLVTSADVIHSFAVPSLGIKVDAIPGRQNQAMLFIKSPGIFRGQCSEICGVNHGFMPIEIKAVESGEFVNWYLAKLKQKTL